MQVCVLTVVLGFRVSSTGPCQPNNLTEKVSCCLLQDYYLTIYINQRHSTFVGKEQRSTPVHYLTVPTYPMSFTYTVVSDAQCCGSSKTPNIYDIAVPEELYLFAFAACAGDCYCNGRDSLRQIDRLIMHFDRKEPFSR
jgi:hypothetical protein